MPPTLIGIARLDAIHPKYLPSFDFDDLTNAAPRLKGWKIVVRGSQVQFHAPPGWMPGTDRKTEGAAVVIQVPRAMWALYWSGLDGKDPPDTATWEMAPPPLPPKAESAKAPAVKGAS